MDSTDYHFHTKFNRMIELLESIDEKLSVLTTPVYEIKPVDAVSNKRLAIDPKGIKPDIWIGLNDEMPDGYRWF